MQTLFEVRVSEFQSEDPGFDPLTGQGEGQFFCPSESTMQILFEVRVSEFQSEDPGFDPLTGQGERQFFCPSESNAEFVCA